MKRLLCFIFGRHKKAVPVGMWRVVGFDICRHCGALYQDDIFIKPIW